MKRSRVYTLYTASLGLLIATLPSPAAAQLAKGPDAGPLEDLFSNILIVVNDVLIPFIIGIGFLFFVWGVFRHFIVGGADEEQRAKGRSFVVNVIIGFVAIIIFWGVVNMITTSIGLEGETIKFIPSTPAPKQ